MKDDMTIVVDLDATLTVPAKGVPYADLEVDREMLEALTRYRDAGAQIVIYTARGMRSHSNSVGAITAKVLPAVIAWLDRHCVPYDGIHVGKPWCGESGFYVDDRAIRPREFVRLSHNEIQALLRRDSC